MSDRKRRHKEDADELADLEKKLSQVEKDVMAKSEEIERVQKEYCELMKYQVALVGLIFQTKMSLIVNSEVPSDCSSE